MGSPLSFLSDNESLFAGGVSSGDGKPLHMLHKFGGTFLMEQGSTYYPWVLPKRAIEVGTFIRPDLLASRVLHDMQATSLKSLKKEKMRKYERSFDQSKKDDVRTEISYQDFGCFQVSIVCVNRQNVLES